MAPRNERLRIRVARLARQTVGVGVYAAGTAVRSRHTRLLGLRAAAELALAVGRLDRAEQLANESLELAEEYSKDWYYGNALHNGHELLGLVRLNRGMLQEAERELLEAGRTPGSPQLNSFGPNMTLARELLLEGRGASVLEYLELCRVFWGGDSGTELSDASHSRLDRWADEIRRGEVPDFGPNLVY